MGVYDSDIRSAIEMIRDAGELCTWRKQTKPDGASDWTESETPVAPVDYPVSVAFFPYNSAVIRGLQFGQQTDIPRADLYGLMGAVAFVPALDDIIIRISGKQLTPVRIDTLDPNGQVILYTIALTT